MRLIQSDGWTEAMDELIEVMAEYRDIMSIHPEKRNEVELKSRAGAIEIVETWLGGILGTAYKKDIKDTFRNRQDFIKRYNQNNTY